jgi:hypothetical protein
MKQSLLALLLAGCATTQSTPAGPKVTVVGSDVQVCLDHGELHAGEQVQLVRRVCRPRTPKTTALECTSQPIAGGQVTRVLDAHCALVRLPTDSSVQPGDQLELATR